MRGSQRVLDFRPQLLLRRTGFEAPLYLRILWRYTKAVIIIIIIILKRSNLFSEIQTRVGSINDCPISSPKFAYLFFNFYSGSMSEIWHRFSTLRRGLVSEQSNVSECKTNSGRTDDEFMSSKNLV